jgi:para-aminobenzoate synthetase
MRTLLVDNYDSFTFNVAQALEVANGVPPLVIRNDERTFSEIESLDFDNIVISPGPGSPENVRDFGVCRDIVLGSDRPILGICMGFQGIALLSGARVVLAPEPWHGRGSLVRHDGAELFEGVPSPFFAVRYHSLHVPDLEGTDLVETARTEAGILMAFRHVTRPVWGVQFHPESIATESGARIFENFRVLTSRYSTRPPSLSLRVDSGRSNRASPPPPERRRVRVVGRRVESDVAPEIVFNHLYRQGDPAVWLDSSRTVSDAGRFSFIADTSGPEDVFVRYRSRDRRLEIHACHESGRPPSVRTGSIFDYLKSELQAFDIGPVDLPFQFRGGFVGYFGYELKGECGGMVRHESELPDAAFLRVSRFIVFDHVRAEWWVVGLDFIGGGDDVTAWIADTASRILDCAARPIKPASPDEHFESDAFTLEKDRSSYVGAIHSALESIRAGESYQVCLTNRVRGAFRGDRVALYQAVRRRNPAPFSAFMRFGEVSILSTSPERFLRIDPDGRIEARPIKGTASRASDPEADWRVREALCCSEKNRSENLMIVDLLRNDLGRVASAGSVRVPSLMVVESYETVHHLVSTVEARLGADYHPVDCIRSAFPGGSMTGAPKVRTMEIIDDLEASARGVYSGALGYLSYDGSVDLSIVIRTIVLNGDRLSIGAGGGIVALSNPRDEFDEAMVKARVLVETVAELSRSGAKSSANPT